MNDNFLETIEKIAEEKGLEADEIMEGIQEAITIACKKVFHVENVEIDFDLETLKFTAEGSKVVTKEDDIEDDTSEISLEDAHKISPKAKIGDTVTFKLDTEGQEFGRSVLQSSKQVLKQKIREAEYEKMIEEFVGSENEIMYAKIEDIKNNNIYMMLDKTLAVLPRSEQIEGEKFDPDENIKVVIKSIAPKSKRGPKITVSRKDPILVKSLFEELVPEIDSGDIEIKSIAREAGDSCKVAVTSHDENLDALGCCIGENGERVNNISAQISGEKIELIKWEDNPNNEESITIKNIAASLAPSSVVSVIPDMFSKKAIVIVPDNQLSLAIGRGGKNARLASKLLSWNIDIKSVSEADEEGIEYTENV